MKYIRPLCTNISFHTHQIWSLNQINCVKLFKICRSISVRSSTSLTKEEEKIQKPIDPIITKYQNFLQNLKPSEDYETLYQTNFGSIRFDSDNPILIDKNNSDVQEEEKCEEEINYIDKFYFQESITNGSTEANSDLIKNVSNVQIPNDLNYIDSQYLYTQINPNSDEKVQATETFQSLDYSNLNAIDSQYFYPALDSSQNTGSEAFKSTSTLNKKQISPNTKEKVCSEDTKIFHSFENSISEDLWDESTNKYKPHMVSQSIEKETSGDTEDRNEGLLTVNEKSYSEDKDNCNEVFSNFEHAVSPDLGLELKNRNKYNMNRDALEKMLIDLSDKSSALLLSKNPKLKTFLEKKEKRNVMEHELLQPNDNMSSSTHSIEKEEEEEEENSFKESELIQPKDKVLSSSHSIEKKVETPSIDPSEESYTKSALKYVLKKRREEFQSNVRGLKKEILPHERYKKVLLNVPRFSLYTKNEAVDYLKNSVIYDKGGIVAINKPYGISMHGGGGDKTNNRLNIVDLLPLVAKQMKKEKLMHIHRLDKNVTGVLLLADNDDMAAELKNMFKNRTMEKTYLAITKGVPKVINGAIDIPIAEGKFDNHLRMTLCADAPGYKVRPKSSKKAITRFKVLSQANSCSLLELNPVTGIKHQLRVHLGFGLNCPVLGDHKYSNLSNLSPQKLSSDALHLFGLKQSAVRHLPMHLHSFSLRIPGMGEKDEELFIHTAPPKFFKISLGALKLAKRYNRKTSQQFSELIYGFE